MSTATDPRLLEPYVFFNGRCEEAIALYQQALGAQLEMLMRFQDSPDPAPPGMVPPGWENKVMHASLRIGTARLMLSDGCAGSASSFAGFSLSFTAANEAEAAQSFAALAQGGKVSMPLGKTFWSPCFGMVEDKFGVGWMITVK